MKKDVLLAQELSNRYGMVKRARGSFLYTQKGVRLTDLFLENGRAILGWGSDNSSSLTVFKNVLNRGISGFFNTDFRFVSVKNSKTPLSKSSGELFESKRISFIFNSKEKALKNAITVSPSSTSVYKPWLEKNIDWSTVDSIVFVPPFAWCENYWILSCKEELLTPELLQKLSEESQKIPAPLEAAFVRSIYDLKKELPLREEKNFFLYDKVLTKYFERKGPYLFPKITEEKYWNFVLHCLDCGIVINPNFNEPSIIPFGADFGVFRKLEKNPFN